MLQSIGLQRVGYNLVTGQQQQSKENTRVDLSQSSVSKIGEVFS